MSFALGVRREPPAGALREPSAWATLERQAGTGAGAFTVAGDTSALSTAHDGLAVTVAAPAGVIVEGRARRRYTVVLDGLRLTPTAAGRVRCYIAVTPSHLSEGPSLTAGLPALAEHIPATPPSSPQMPPDPLWASLPDAENRSTIALAWTVPADGASTAMTYQVLRAGENDVAAAAVARALDPADPRRSERDKAHDVYLNAGSPAQRAGALKRLAVFAEDVFTLDRDRLPAARAGQPMSATCELTGSLRTLTVFCARGASAVGASSAWPIGQDSFAVVAVPQPVLPSPPVVLRAAQEGPTAELRVAHPPASSAPVAGYELYRTRDPALAAAADFRRLALKSVVAVAGSTWQGPPGSEFALLHDADVRADQRYFYVAVARAPNVSGGLGPRSRPSAVVGVDIGAPPVWIPLPTLAVTGLPAVVRRPAGRLDILIRGSDDRVRVIGAEASTWSEWQPLDGAAPAGTEVTSDPARRGRPGRALVACRQSGALRFSPFQASESRCSCRQPTERSCGGV